MPDRPNPRTPLELFGVIRAAANEHDTSAELWDRLNAEVAAGHAAQPPLFGQYSVNSMRSLATKQVEAQAALSRARPEDAITYEHIGTALYARPDADQTVLPKWHVNYELTTVKAGVESTDVYHLEYTRALPPTIGDLLDDVEEVGFGLADTYGVTPVSVGAVEIQRF